MNSKRPVVPEGLDASTRQLATVDARQGTLGRSAKARRVLGLIWCFIGGSLMTLVPILACTLVAYGIAMVASGGQRRERVAALLVALVASVADTYLLLGVVAVPTTAIEVLCAYALACTLIAGRLKTNGFLIEVVALALAMIGIDVVSASLQDTSITELITMMVNQTVEATMESVDLEGTATLLEMRDSMVAYWPTLYFLVAAGVALFSLLGAWIGAKASGAAVEPGMIARYDVPLWVAVLFALGVAIELLGPVLPAWQEEAAMVGANVVMCTRVALAQQGLSVLQWRLREQKVAWPVRATVVLLAVWLELSFALASVAGLIDVAFNFRRFDRGRPSFASWSAGER